MLRREESDRQMTLTELAMEKLNANAGDKGNRFDV